MAADRPPPERAPSESGDEYDGTRQASVAMNNQQISSMIAMAVKSALEAAKAEAAAARP